MKLNKKSSKVNNKTILTGFSFHLMVRRDGPCNSHGHKASEKYDCLHYSLTDRWLYLI